MWKSLQAKGNMALWMKGKKFSKAGVQRVREKELKDETGQEARSGRASCAKLWSSDFILRTLRWMRRFNQESEDISFLIDHSSCRVEKRQEGRKFPALSLLCLRDLPFGPPDPIALSSCQRSFPYSPLPSSKPLIPSPLQA